MSYLSSYPEGLKEAFLTGGLAPIVNNPDGVYERTKCENNYFPPFFIYRLIVSYLRELVQVEKRNAVYYKKYPQDVRRIRAILAYLDENDVTLPNGGRLSPNRFLQLGIKFGGESTYIQEHIILHGLNCLE